MLTGPAELSSRGTGVLEMARAIRADRPHRASGELAYHVLDTMISIEEAITTSSFVTGAEHLRAAADRCPTTGTRSPPPSDATALATPLGRPPVGNERARAFPTLYAGCNVGIASGRTCT